MGRLAVDQRQHGNGCGEMLLQNAVKRCLSIREEITYYALVVDGRNEGAARFYAKYGFLPCTDEQMQRCLPLGKATT